MIAIYLESILIDFLLNVRIEGDANEMKVTENVFKEISDVGYENGLRTVNVINFIELNFCLKPQSKENANFQASSSIFVLGNNSS